MRSVESTRNQTTQMRSFGRDLSNIINQPVYRKENIGDAYNQKRLVSKGDSSERAKRAASVSNGQPNKQFLTKRGSNTLKTLRSKNIKNNASGMITTHLPNLHNTSGTSNSSKNRGGSNTSGHNQVNKEIVQSSMPQVNNVITMSKEMISTKINGLSNLNIVKKKNIRTKKSNNRQDSKSSFASDANGSKKVYLSTTSQDGSSAKKSSAMNPTIQTMNNSIPSNKSDSNEKAGSEEKLKRFRRKMERTLSTNPEPIEDPLCCAEYVVEIYEHMLKTEHLYLPKIGFMKIQDDINERMRAILIDWLVEVHLKFKLVPETLYLTVNLIDRYLEIEQVKRDKLQLIGVTAMLIACKYEEIYPPEVKDFVYITDNAYTKQEIQDMEYLMLKKFNFNVTIISSYRFIERFVRLAQETDDIFYLAQYVIELSLVEYKMIKYKPSILASGAIYLARKIMCRADSWPLKVEQYCKLKEKDVRPCAKELCILLQGVASSSLQAIKKKFSLPKFCEVAKIQIDTA